MWTEPYNGSIRFPSGIIFLLQDTILQCAKILIVVNQYTMRTVYCLAKRNWSMIERIQLMKVGTVPRLYWDPHKFHLCMQTADWPVIWPRKHRSAKRQCDQKLKSCNSRENHSGNYILFIDSKYIYLDKELCNRHTISKQVKNFASFLPPHPPKKRDTTHLLSFCCNYGYRL